MLITNHSGKKPYAQSTLIRKYKETGVSQETIEIWHDYLTACANFYHIIELEKARQNFIKVTGKRITKKLVYELISIDARNNDLSYDVYPESYFYVDGDESIILIICKYLLRVDHYYFEPACQSTSEKQEVMNGDTKTSEQEIKKTCEFDTDRFYELHRAKCSKKDYFIPDDLMKYVNPCYYSENEYSNALKSFLSNVLHQSKKEAERKTREIVLCIKDQTISPTEGLKVAMAIATDIDLYKIDDACFDMTMEQIQAFANLYFNLSNHTYLPYNNGYSPTGLHEASNYDGSIQQIHFGPGIRDAIARGQIDADEFKQGILNANFSAENKFAMLSGLKEAEKQIEIDKKVGRNDPCPCGSGKKYKKCCGR